MGLTIRRRESIARLRGNPQAGCAYCGTQWRRSELRRDGSGKLSCRDCKDYEGRDEVSLARKNAAMASNPQRRYRQTSENHDVGPVIGAETVHITEMT